jgi:hypothetical protein
MTCLIQYNYKGCVLECFIPLIGNRIFKFDTDLTSTFESFQEWTWKFYCESSERVIDIKVTVFLTPSIDLMCD